MKGTIEGDTPIIPHAVAERAVEAVEAYLLQKSVLITDEFHGAADDLAADAERCYANNDKFAKRVRAGAGRD